MKKYISILLAVVLSASLLAGCGGGSGNSEQKPATEAKEDAAQPEENEAAEPAADAAWTVIPDMGRTLSGVALMPYTVATDGGALSYRVQLPEGTSSVKVHVVTKSTLAFNNTGHR